MFGPCITSDMFFFQIMTYVYYRYYCFIFTFVCMIIKTPKKDHDRKESVSRLAVKFELESMRIAAHIVFTSCQKTQIRLKCECMKLKFQYNNAVRWIHWNVKFYHSILHNKSDWYSQNQKWLLLKWIWQEVSKWTID